MIHKNWFISQYEEIHKNLNHLGKEIERQKKDKFQILKDPLILENLRKEIEFEIERLNKTREHERRIFGYENLK